MVSISSIKMMQGGHLAGLLEEVPDPEAPTPTNISTKSEPEMEKKGDVGLAGHGLGQQRLAGAGAHQQRAR